SLAKAQRTQRNSLRPLRLCERSSLRTGLVTAEAFTLDLQDMAATVAFGRRLGGLLFPGAVIALVGPLGAGKTHLVRAIAEGLGADPRQVSSPTFVLIQEYDAALPVYHFDAYRLRTQAEFADLGVHEYFQGKGVCLVEWADKVRECLPEQLLTIQIIVTGAETRLLEIEARGKEYVTALSLVSVVSGE